MASALSARHFHDEKAAFAWVEKKLWPNGPICPHCGGVERISKMQGKATRLGLHKCYQCRQQFTVKVGTVFEQSHVALNVWLQAIALMSSSKKGISSNQLHRTLGVTLKTAWFMSHRIRMAMVDGRLGPLGGAGKVVEVDETYHGKVETPLKNRKDTGKPLKKAKGGYGPANKRAIVALVERGGSARTFHVAEASAEVVAKIVRDNIDPASRLHTDASSLYLGVGKEFAEHASVRHSMGEYVRYENGEAIHNNSAESYFSVFKRGMKGVYQHCSEKHLHRYLAEFEFRHNARVALGVDDGVRADKLLAGVVGKRLTYRTAH
jgi:transposase-like protein